MKNNLPTSLLKMYSLASTNESYSTRQNVKFKIKPQIRNTVQTVLHMLDLNSGTQFQKC